MSPCPPPKGSPTPPLRWEKMRGASLPPTPAAQIVAPAEGLPSIPDTSHLLASDPPGWPPGAEHCFSHLRAGCEKLELGSKAPSGGLLKLAMGVVGTCTPQELANTATGLPHMPRPRTKGLLLSSLLLGLRLGRKQRVGGPPATLLWVPAEVGLSGQGQGQILEQLGLEPRESSQPGRWGVGVIPGRVLGPLACVPAWGGGLSMCICVSRSVCTYASVCQCARVSECGYSVRVHQHVCV